MLPLACTLGATKKPSIVGRDYQHPHRMLAFAVPVAGVGLAFNSLLPLWKA